MAHFAVEPFAAFFALGVNPKSADRPRLAQAYILQTADGQLIAIHLSSLEKFWSGLVRATEADHLIGDARFTTRLLRIDNYEALGEQLNAIFKRRPISEWAERLKQHDVPFAPIHNIEAVVADPQVRHLGLVVPVEARSGGANFAVRSPLQFDGARGDSVSAAPLLNQHGESIRMALAASKDWPAAKCSFVANVATG
jgi:crotonobetainyl-CoA:carnitine CoA-transferase CaiB-like acyl-CoA transferase